MMWVDLGARPLTPALSRKRETEYVYASANSANFFFTALFFKVT
jgi:hypothetical protein